MNEPTMNEVRNRIRYNTSSATLLADDVYWDGNNMERSGRNTFLYRTPAGRYFLVTRSQWQGETDRLIPLSMEDAESSYERLEEKYVEYEEAFPDVDIEDDSDEIRLSPIHLGTGEVGRQRRKSLEQIAASGGHEWGGKPSIGKLIVAIADGETTVTELAIE